MIRLRPRAGEDTLRTEDVLDRRWSDRVALVLLGGVNYLTGELMDIPTITAAGQARRAPWSAGTSRTPPATCRSRLHDWDVDWAAWCTYKYLNSGPGAVAGAFVHERHLADRTLPKLQGWWSTDQATRFAMGPVVDPVDDRRRLAAVQPADPRDGARCWRRWRCSTRSAWRPCGNAACG